MGPDGNQPQLVARQMQVLVRRRCTDRVGRRGDDGSAVVDFALVGGLLTLLFISVVQVALIVHVRNTLIDCAGEGARYAAREGRGPDDGIARSRALVASELTAGYAQRLTEVRADVIDVDGVRTVEVSLSAPLPMVALLGPAGVLQVRGHAFAEDQVFDVAASAGRDTL